MATNEDIAKILGILGAIIAILDVVLGFSGSAGGNFLNLDTTLELLVALIISVIALVVSLKPNGVFMIIMGILVIIFASLIGGILILVGGIVELID